jgi:hypothetical protein
VAETGWKIAEVEYTIACECGYEEWLVCVIGAYCPVEICDTYYLVVGLQCMEE